MAVYVDDMLRKAKVGRGRPARWSHLMADTPEELEAFRRRLKLARSWLQYEGTHREHYDVTATVREQALKLGALPITYPADMATLIDARRAACRCTSITTCRWADAPGGTL